MILLTLSLKKWLDVPYRGLRFCLLSLLIMMACVDRIDFDAGPGGASQIVIDGFISDEPGPYTVRLTRSQNIDDNLRVAPPFSANRVIVSDNLGNVEELEEGEFGVYQTKPNGIRGMVGRTYTLRIENRDGTVYESSPELLRPVGKVDSIYYEFESVVPESGPTRHGFKIFIDAQSEGGTESFMRWKFTGTFRIETNPELHDVPCGESRCPDPRPCSGYVITNVGLTRVADCLCCVCWVNEIESRPLVSDNQFVSGGKFRKVQVGFVEVNEFTFFDRYQVEVEQMSLSRAAFDFWRAVQAQQEGTSSLFQPPFGKAKTNIFPVNGGPEVQGIFYASSVNRKSRFITRDEVPVEIPDLSVVISESCNLVFDFASTTKPLDWN